jgi:hypothetical protein
MSEDKQLDVDESSLVEGKESLAHVETKEGVAAIKSILFCGSCSHKEDIPAEWEEMDTMPEAPKCPKCGAQMQVKIEGS